MNTNTLKIERRQSVAKKYCRTMAIIDDDIFEPRDSFTLSERFAGILQDCQESGILCHLYQYPWNPSYPDAERANRQAVNLANSADVIVLDWSLGISNNPENCIKILRQILSGPKAFRYITIYTMQDISSVDNILKGMPELEGLRDIVVHDENETDFDEYITVTGDNDLMEEPDESETFTAESVEDVPTPNNPSDRSLPVEDFNDTSPDETTGVGKYNFNTPRSYDLDGTFFISVRRKQDKNEVSDQLVTFIQERLLQSFPDHLHWAGLEIASRARESLLKVIATLPLSTSKALLFQMLYQENDEVAHQVTEILLEELRLALIKEPLWVVKDDILFDELVHSVISLSEDDATIGNLMGFPMSKIKKGTEIVLAEELASKIAALRDAWMSASLDNIRDVAKSLSKAKKDYFPSRKQNSEIVDERRLIAEYIRSCPISQSDDMDHVRWAGVRESVLTVPDGDMETGYICEDLNRPDDGARWLLCISPLCDCAQPKDGYLFVVGKELSDNKFHSSEPKETQSCIILHSRNSNAPAAKQIAWQSGSVRFVSKEEINDPKKYQLVGALRSQFVLRIIHRVFGWQSRVGVDTSELLRVSVK